MVWWVGSSCGCRAVGESGGHVEVSAWGGGGLHRTVCHYSSSHTPATPATQPVKISSASTQHIEFKTVLRILCREQTNLLYASQFASYNRQLIDPAQEIGCHGLKLDGTAPPPRRKTEYKICPNKIDLWDAMQSFSTL